MPNVITYRGEGGQLIVVTPAPDCGLTLEEIAAKDVPEGIAFEIVDAGTLPPPPAPPPPKPTPREWLERLPTDRQQAIVDAMLGNPGAGRLWIVRALGTGTVDVADPETIQGVNDMRAAGILISDAERDLLLAP